MKNTKIYIGSDHAGFELKQHLYAFLLGQGSDIEDCGTYNETSCDYPDYALAVSDKVIANPGSLGILICGTGIGVSITANKIHGILAARCTSIEDAELARKHNGANIICLGGRQIAPDLAEQMVNVFLETETEEGRHANRRAKIHQIEQSQCKKN